MLVCLMPALEISGWILKIKIKEKKGGWGAEDNGCIVCVALGNGADGVMYWELQPQHGALGA